ncbi:hypothetical protein TNCV_4402151 [Trichonephila clavipes]|nr:hypothetical protein TNCV_4402151 [Trichonephila clavipes]
MLPLLAHLFTFCPACSSCGRLIMPIGGALHQVVDSELQPLAFFSRKLTSSEKSYSAYDRELLLSTRLSVTFGICWKPLEASARRFVSLPAYSTIGLVNPLKSLVLRCGCRRFGNRTFVYGLRNATMHSHLVVSPVMILSILLWLRTWMLKLSYVSDIVLSPPNSDKYHTLSQRLITQFSDSETQKLRNCLLTFS